MLSMKEERVYMCMRNNINNRYNKEMRASPKRRLMIFDGCQSTVANRIPLHTFSPYEFFFC